MNLFVVVVACGIGYALGGWLGVIVALVLISN